MKRHLMAAAALAALMPFAATAQVGDVGGARGQVTGAVAVPTLDADIGVEIKAQPDVYAAVDTSAGGDFNPVIGAVTSVIPGKPDETPTSGEISRGGHATANIDPMSAAMVGATVFGADGQSIGIVQGLETDDGRTTGVVVAISQGINAPAGSIVLPTTSTTFDASANVVTTTMTRAELGL